MNKLRILYVLLICTVCTCVFVACKKKKGDEPKKEEVNNNPNNRTPQELLSNGTWKVTALTSSVAGDVWGNATIIKPCNKDNTYIFHTNNTLTTFDTPTKCLPSDPDSTSGPYILFDNNKKIYLELKFGTTQIKDTTDVKQLDENTMILNIEYSGFPGEITFKH